MNKNAVAPHDWKAGLRRAPLHLGTFGAAGLTAAILLPPPFSWLPAAALVCQAVRGEVDDVQNGEDTIGKAIIDGVTQSLPAVIGALI